MEVSPTRHTSVGSLLDSVWFSCSVKRNQQPPGCELNKGL